MPIRPEYRHHYGPAWRALSRRMREEAGVCQCTGQCGRHCGVLCKSEARLTVAHLNHTPGDDRPENLLVLCAACHLRYDRQWHADQRAARRLARERAVARAAGQLELWTDGEASPETSPDESA